MGGNGGAAGAPPLTDRWRKEEESESRNNKHAKGSARRGRRPGEYELSDAAMGRSAGMPPRPALQADRLWLEEYHVAGSRRTGDGSASGLVGSGPHDLVGQVVKCGAV